MKKQTPIRLIPALPLALILFSQSAAAALIDRNGWTLASSHNTTDRHFAIDGNSATRWTTRQPQSPGQSFTVHLNHLQTIDRIVLRSTPSDNDQPRSYIVYITTGQNDHTADTVAATGNGDPDGNTVIQFAPRPARSIRVEQTGNDAHHWWSIHEINVHAASTATADADVIDSTPEVTHNNRQTTNRHWRPVAGWRDSYAVDGICYCDSTNYDHGIGEIMVSTPDGQRRSVVQICEDIKATFGTGRISDRIPYNTIACGHGPANNAPDENLQSGCPGRVDRGAAGCFELGPAWPLDLLYSDP